MKTITKILGIALLAAAAVALSSCTEEPEFTPGDPDVDGCYGVYFPDQNTSLTLDPNDSLALTLSVKRTNTADAITVPYTFTNESGVFVIEDDIAFAAGQDSTSVLVTFANAEMGTTYTCTITIEDPQYYSVYSSNLPGITISVLRDKWNDLGIALYTDDYFTTFWSVDNVTWEVPVQESDLHPGLYRLEYPYDGKYIYNDSWETDPDDYAYGEADWDTSQTYWFTVNAEDPEGVYIDLQPIGVDWGYGMIYAYSYAAYYMDHGYDLADAKEEGYCGTLKNGYITFPDSELLIYMPGYSSSYYYANTNGAFKIVLPGAADYTMEITADECSNGEAPLHFELGENVDHVRYQIYEGSLKESEVTAYADSIAADSLGVASVLLEDTDFNVILDETGIYTLVAVSFSKDEETGVVEAQENASCTIYYVAAGDDMSVVAGAGMYATNKNNNYSSTALQFFIYGEDLTSVKYSLIPTEDYDYYPAYYQEYVKSELDCVDDDVLETINSSAYTAVLTRKTPGTSYTLVVWASNGYESTFVTAEATTADVTWSEYAQGDYTYTLLFYDYAVDDDGNYILDDDGYPVEIPFVDEGLTLYASSDPSYWKIGNWGYGVDFTFFYDKKSGDVYAEDQYTGHYSNFYGPTYVDDYADYTDKSYAYSYFEDDVFNFCLVYYCAYGVYASGYGETFEIKEDDASESSVKPASIGESKKFNIKTNMKPVQSLKRAYTAVEVDSHVANVANFTVTAGTPSAKTSNVSETAVPSSVNKSHVNKAHRVEGLL